MKCLYKYSRQAYPYGDLVETNRGRNRLEPEYELIDTGVFAEVRRPAFGEAEKFQTDPH